MVYVLLFKQESLKVDPGNPKGAKLIGEPEGSLNQIVHDMRSYRRPDTSIGLPIAWGYCRSTM